MQEPLAALLADGTAAQRGAAAIALGLLGDDRCIPALRELVKNRSEYHYLDSRRSNQMPSVIAICLLGRFKDAEIVPELLSILQPEEFEKPMYHVYLTPYYKLSIIKELNSVYYQHYSFAVAALAAIAKAHPTLHDDIFAAMEEATASDDYIRRMTDDPPGSSIDLVARHLRRWIREQKNA
jgi:HEAT repeat protein